MTDKEDASRRWKGYVEELFYDEKGVRPPMDGKPGAPKTLEAGSKDSKTDEERRNRGQ